MLNRREIRELSDVEIASLLLSVHIAYDSPREIVRSIAKLSFAPEKYEEYRADLIQRLEQTYPDKIKIIRECIEAHHLKEGVMPPPHERNLFINSISRALGGASHEVSIDKDVVSISLLEAVAVLLHPSPTVSAAKEVVNRFSTAFPVTMPLEERRTRLCDYIKTHHQGLITVLDAHIGNNAAGKYSNQFFASLQFWNAQQHGAGSEIHETSARYAFRDFLQSSALPKDYDIDMNILHDATLEASATRILAAPTQVEARSVEASDRALTPVVAASNQIG